MHCKLMYLEIYQKQLSSTTSQEGIDPDRVAAYGGKSVDASRQVQKISRFFLSQCGVEGKDVDDVFI